MVKHKQISSDLWHNYGHPMSMLFMSQIQGNLSENLRLTYWDMYIQPFERKLIAEIQKNYYDNDDT